MMAVSVVKWLPVTELLDPIILPWPTDFLQCFDTVGLVIWSVKIVPEMTRDLLSGMLSLYTTTSEETVVCVCVYAAGS